MLLSLVFLGHFKTETCFSSSVDQTIHRAWQTNLESVKSGSGPPSPFQSFPKGNHSQTDVFVCVLRSNRHSHSRNCFSQDSFSQQRATSFHLPLRSSFTSAGNVSRQFPHLFVPPHEGLLEVTEVPESSCKPRLGSRAILNVSQWEQTWP